MSNLLYIKSSPRAERSFSSAASDAFIKAYRERHPEDNIQILDLFEKELPGFDGQALEAKYAILNGQAPSSEQATAWGAVEAIISEFKSADKYVFAVPMWNFLFPYRLKHYLDIIVQPSYTFSFSPEDGYQGLVTGKPVLLALARGGEYPAGSEAEDLDFQTKYLRMILGFIGFTDIRLLVSEPTLSSPEQSDSLRAAVTARAREMAGEF